MRAVIFRSGFGGRSGSSFGGAAILGIGESETGVETGSGAAIGAGCTKGKGGTFAAGSVVPTESFTGGLGNDPVGNESGVDGLL